MAYSKYHAKKVEYEGRTFDSTKEFKRYKELKLLERQKIITDLQLQVPFILIEKSEYGRAIRYVADFTYYENGKFIVEDVKGYRTDVYKLKKRLFEEKFKMKITEV